MNDQVLRAEADREPAADKTTAGQPSSPVDTDLVRQLAEIVGTFDLSEIDIEKGDLHIRVKRQRAAPVSMVATPDTHVIQVAAVPSSAPAASAGASHGTAGSIDRDHSGLVKSPMVGTVYRRSNPESKPFVDVGATVKSGDRVLLVEAMKTFNDIVAHKSGTVAAILIEDGQPVEYGEPLLLIE